MSAEVRSRLFRDFAYDHEMTLYGGAVAGTRRR